MPGHDPKPVQAAPKSRQRSRFRRIIVGMAAISAGCVLVAAVFLIFERGQTRRFDPGMETVEAEILRDKAVDDHDSEAWIAIHEEILWPRFIQSIDTEWTSMPRLVLKHRSISKAMDVLNQNRYIVNTEEVEFWGRALGMIDRHYKPRITQATIDKMAEILKRTYPEAYAMPLVIGESLNTRLSVYVERQGRLGDAADQSWLAFLDMFTPVCFERWLRLQTSGSAFLLDESSRKSLTKQHENHPDDPWMARLAGLIRCRDGKFAEAEPLLANSADLFDNDPEGRHAWAEARLALSLPVEVNSIMGPKCRDSIHFETQEAMRQTLRAQLFEKQGKLEAASQDAEAAVKLDPRSRQAWATLANVAKKAGDAERSHFAEARAKEWSDREDRLKSALKSFAIRIFETRAKDRRMKDDGGTIDPLIQALQDLEWQSAAKEYETGRKIATGEILHSGFRKFPEIQPGVPDRFFQPRPVLRSETPQSRGLGGVKL